MMMRPLFPTVTLLAIVVTSASAQRVHRAAADGNVDRLESVLSCDGDLVHATDHMGATPLHIAALEGHTDVVSLLLEEGSPPNAVEAHGLTPLHYAVLRGHTKVVHLLLAAGADPNYRSNVDSPTPTEVAILADAFRGTTTLTAALLAAGGTIDPEAGAAVLPSTVFTAHLAGNLAMVRLLHELLQPPESTAANPGGNAALN